MRSKQLPWGPHFSCCVQLPWSKCITFIIQSFSLFSGDCFTLQNVRWKTSTPKSQLYVRIFFCCGLDVLIYLKVLKTFVKKESHAPTHTHFSATRGRNKNYIPPHQGKITWMKKRIRKKAMFLLLVQTVLSL